MELTTVARLRRYSDLCRDLFVLAQVTDETSGPARGWRWEARIAALLTARGFPVESIPGGVRVFGVLPASGLRHQTDAAIACADAHIVGEWKAYRGPVPKNEVLRFKAATDDLYDALVARPLSRPVLRLFGVSGDASDPLRRYAARHGITLVERSRWPAPVLADPALPWPADSLPAAVDRQHLAWLSRPLQHVYPRLPNGSLQLPTRLPDVTVTALLRLHDSYSARLWLALDAHPGAFERYAGPLLDLAA